MGEAKRKADIELSAGITKPKPPKIILRTWQIAFSEEANAAFMKVYDYLQKRLGANGPQKTQDLAERMLAVGMKFFLAEIAKEERATSVQTFSPADLEEVSRRLQAIKQETK